jgi:hypothetical protein
MRNFYDKIVDSYYMKLCEENGIEYKKTKMNFRNTPKRSRKEVIKEANKNSKNFFKTKYE